jgi:hypothetical protein
MPRRNEFMHTPSQTRRKRQPEPARPTAEVPADERRCVMCGRWLKVPRVHVDTCGERCFQRLLAWQREALGI